MFILNANCDFNCQKGWKICEGDGQNHLFWRQSNCYRINLFGGFNRFSRHFNQVIQQQGAQFQFIDPLVVAVRKDSV
jgi:hypothetical protein